MRACIVQRHGSIDLSDVVDPNRAFVCGKHAEQREAAVLQRDGNHARCRRDRSRPHVPTDTPQRDRHDVGRRPHIARGGWSLTHIPIGVTRRSSANSTGLAEVWPNLARMLRSSRIEVRRGPKLQHAPGGVSSARWTDRDGAADGFPDQRSSLTFSNAPNGSLPSKPSIGWDCFPGRRIGPERFARARRCGSSRHSHGDAAAPKQRGRVAPHHFFDRGHEADADLTSTGPVCGRSFSLMMPSRLATSVKARSSRRVAAEASYQVSARLDVPQPARSGEIVADHDPHVVSHSRPHCILKWTSRMPTPRKSPQEVVDADRQRHDVVDLCGGPAERRDVLSDTIGSLSLSFLVEFDDRARNCVPSSIPRRVASDPAATFRRRLQAG